MPILNQRLKFQPLTMSNQDAQIIDQRKLNDQAVAAVFGVPMILLGVSDTATAEIGRGGDGGMAGGRAGLADQPHRAAFDQFVGLNTDRSAGREWTEYDTEVLLRSAFKDRIDGLARGVQAGIYAPDEARYKLEACAAVPGGSARCRGCSSRCAVAGLGFRAARTGAGAAARRAPPPDDEEPADPTTRMRAADRAWLTKQWDIRREQSRVPPDRALMRAVAEVSGRRGTDSATPPTANLPPTWRGCASGSTNMAM